MAAWTAHRVDSLPGDQHCHDRGFSDTGGELQCDAQQLGICLLVRTADVRPDFRAGRRAVGGDLGEPDGGLDRLDLAKEGPQVIELMMPPVLEQPSGFRRYLPLVRVRQAPPGCDVATNFIDDRGRIVFLLGSREAISGAEAPFALTRRATTLLRLRHRRDQLRAATVVDEPVRRLAVRIQLAEPAGIDIL